ncbi:MAG: prepilin-type N-terminal cleavage/methylation domain-containing protein [Halioglobus sp.]
MNYRSNSVKCPPRARRGKYIACTRHSGFTLLELMVVVIVLSLAAGITAANLQRGSAGTQLESEARKLTSLMRLLRVRSMSQGIIFAVEADDEIGGYRTNPDEKEFPLPEGMSLTCDPESEVPVINLSGIHFYPDGSSSGGVCQLSIATDERYIEVSWLTGGVSVVRPKL